MSDFRGIYEEALAAAKAAAEVENQRLGPEGSRGLDCGFAWVTLRPATTPFVRWLRASAIGSKGWNGGWCIWSPADYSTQSISVHRAGAVAFVEVLARHNIGGAEVGSRYD